MMIPFFVADRPMSLRLLKGLYLTNYAGVRIGIMAHANTTNNFKSALESYPCDNRSYCDAIGGACTFDDVNICDTRRYILEHTIKMCDSGIFTREGAKLTYDELFKSYDEMGVEYGIMIDVLGDANATLKSAKEALLKYQPYTNKFKLVGVAQGSNLEDYMDCYRKLRKMGFDYVAIGGLLRRRDNTVRFPYLADEDFTLEVLNQVRNEFPDDWLFALGSLHPERVHDLNRLNVWADSKGWIFQYEKRNDAIDRELGSISFDHLEHIEVQTDLSSLKKIQGKIASRCIAVKGYAKTNEALVEGRRKLRTLLKLVNDELQSKHPTEFPRFKNIITHALMDKSEEKMVYSVLSRLGYINNHPTYTNIRTLITNNRGIKSELCSYEKKIERYNVSIYKLLLKLKDETTILSQETIEKNEFICQLINSTEQQHRSYQVKESIADKYLSVLFNNDE